MHVTAEAMRPRLRAKTALVMILAAGTVSGRAQNAAGAPIANETTAQAVQYNLGLVEFVSTAKLAPAERAALAKDVMDSTQKNPQGEAKRDGLIATTLENAAKFPKDAPRLRELWRYDIATHLEHDDAEYLMVEKHDPVLALDTRHQRIVTWGSVIALNSCMQWLAQNLHKAAPGPKFDENEAVYLKMAYGKLGDDEQDAYAHVGRNCAHAPDFFNGVAAAQRTQFFTNNAKAVTDVGMEAKDAALIARIVYNILLRRAGGNAAMQGRVFDFMVQQSLLQQQLLRSVTRNPALPPPN
jgi:hypothetical protein